MRRRISAALLSNECALLPCREPKRHGRIALTPCWGGKNNALENQPRGSRPQTDRSDRNIRFAHPDRRRLLVFQRRLQPAAHHSLHRSEPKHSLVKNASARKPEETSGLLDRGRRTRFSGTRWLGRRRFG